MTLKRGNRAPTRVADDWQARRAVPTTPRSSTEVRGRLGRGNRTSCMGEVRRGRALRRRARNATHGRGRVCASGGAVGRGSLRNGGPPARPPRLNHLDVFAASITGGKLPAAVGTLLLPRRSRLASFLGRKHLQVEALAESREAQRLGSFANVRSMAASLKKTDTDRVVHVDFSGSFRTGCTERPASGERPALREMPDHRNEGRSMPGASSLAAVAQLVAAHARADTVEGDLEVICRLLADRCAWNEESLILLRQAVATALDHSGHSRHSSGRGTSARS